MDQVGIAISLQVMKLPVNERESLCNWAQVASYVNRRAQSFLPNWQSSTVVLPIAG